MEITIGGATYQVRKLTPFQQFHIARRLAPALWALGASMAGAASNNDSKGALSAFEPLAEVISKMSDADSEYILTTCLSVVFLQQGNAWAPIMPKAGGGALMFDSITLPEMMQLTVEVIKDNLGNFFVALPGV